MHRYKAKSNILKKLHSKCILSTNTNNAISKSNHYHVFDNNSACKIRKTHTQLSRRVIRNLSNTNGGVHHTIPFQPPQYVSECLLNKVNNGDILHDKIQEKAANRLTKLQKALTKVHGVKEPEMQMQHEKDSVNFNTLSNVSMNINAEVDEVTPTTSNNSTKVSNNNKPTMEEISDPITPIPKKQIPRGLYLYGPVGTGKTMLMDLFYSTTTETIKKKRIHFYEFMQEVHAHIHSIKEEKTVHTMNTSVNGRDIQTNNITLTSSTTISGSTTETTQQQQQQTDNNPIVRVAKSISNDINLLCIDEFQVTDIADAFIISQLFEILFHQGTVLVCTSNLPPSQLYENGLHRNYFVPFIDSLEKYCIVHSMSPAIVSSSLVQNNAMSSQQQEQQLDYRRVISNQSGSIHDYFFVYSNHMEYISAKSKCLDVLQLLATTHDNNSITEPKSIDIDVAFKRTLHIPSAILTTKNVNVCSFHYKDLCETDLGASDYRAIAQKFNAIIIEGIPILSIENETHNSSRRFITLIDELYEGRCALLCSAEAHPDHLFAPDNNSSLEDEDLLSNGGDCASINELLYAFQRTRSRLFEMCSKLWWDKNVYFK